MTSGSPSDDELASAYLDEEASPDERALVEADPEVLERVAVQRAVRAALAGSVPVRAPAERDAALAAALRAAPARLDGRRSARRRTRALVMLGAAAAVVAVIAVAGSRTTNQPSTSAGRPLGQSPSSQLVAAQSEGATAARSPAVAPEPGGSTGAKTAVSTDLVGAPFLGVVDDEATLRAAIADAPAADEAAVPAPRCTVAGARLLGVALWAGTAAYVFVRADEAVVVDQVGCDELAVVALK